MRRFLLFSACATAVISLVAWVCLRSAPTQPTFAQYPKNAVGPYAGVRFVANHLTAEQIRFITFSGLAMGCSDAECLHISNKKAINGLLQALRSATIRRGRVGLGNKDCSLTIHFVDGKKINNEKEHTFDFSSYDSLDRFGPKFDEAMKFAGEQEAQETRQIAHQLSSKVKAVTIGKTTISSPEKIKEIMSELQLVNQHAFAYMVEGADADFIFTLHLKDGTSRAINFAIGPSSQGKPPLPPLLWSYYLQDFKTGIPQKP